MRLSNLATLELDLVSILDLGLGLLTPVGQVLRRIIMARLAAIHAVFQLGWARKI